jgi:hypothetical protein
MRVSLKPGLEIRAMPFGCALVLDRDRLAVIEVDDDVTGLFARHGTVEVGTLPQRLAARLARGVDEGWLIREERG